MEIAIIKYNSGNVQSVKNAMDRIGVDTIVTDDIKIIESADKVIFPGVGEASTAMSYLKERGLDEVLMNLKQPVLGICLGLQLMCNYSEEGDTDCMGIFDIDVKKFPPKDKVPHMGWNTITNLTGDLYIDIKEESYVYFVHSFYAEQSDNAISQTDFILPYSSSIQKDNFYATQFHLEKSGEIGQQILKNFIAIK
ncbi:MAG: imidazole glycerol phosphate synthase subunit HisH [Flavobacteriales bacterium]|nr:imidazole glycerol phosphate synthase subunit HisH [Flavobacteriales bacterium]